MVDPHVPGRIVLARIEGGGDGGACGGVRIGVVGVIAALILVGDHVAPRQGAQIEHDVIVARLEAGEVVVSAWIGGGGVHVVAVGVNERNLDPLDAGLIGILDAVTVGVVPNGVSEGGWLIKPEVHGHISIVIILRRGCCTGEACFVCGFCIGLEIVVRRADTIAFVIIAIFITVIIGSIITALACARLHAIKWLACTKLACRDVHKIVPGNHIVKDITTVCLRLRRSDRGGHAWCIAGMVELHRHAGDTCLRAVLDPIVGDAICAVSIIIPDDISDSNRRGKPEIQCMVICPIVTGRVVDG